MKKLIYIILGLCFFVPLFVHADQTTVSTLISATLTKSDGSWRIFSATSSTDYARGQALVAACAAATTQASSTLRLSSGTFWVASNSWSCKLATSSAMIGAGPDITVIKAGTDLDNTGTVIALGTNSYVADLSVIWSPEANNFWAGIGCSERSPSTQICPTAATISNVKVYGGSTDALYLYKVTTVATTTLNVFNSFFQSSWDSGFFGTDPTATKGYILNSFNTLFDTEGSQGRAIYSSAFNVLNLSNAITTLNIYGGALIASTTSNTANYGLYLDNATSTTVNLYGTQVTHGKWSGSVGAHSIFLHPNTTINNYRSGLNPSDVSNVTVLPGNPNEPATAIGYATVNVGVGTTTPGGKFSVGGQYGATSDNLSDASNPTDAPPKIYSPETKEIQPLVGSYNGRNIVLYANDGSAGGSDAGVPGNGGNVILGGGLGDTSGSPNGTNGNVLISQGNLGVGTTSPYAKLSVAGSSGVVAEKYTATTTDGSVLIGNVLSGAAASTDAGAIRLDHSLYSAGLITEVDGSLLSYAINAPQIGTRDTSALGGIFRLDTRGGSTPLFSIIRYPTGGSTAFFDVMSSGGYFGINLGSGIPSVDGALEVGVPDTATAPGLMLRATANHAYGFDWDVESQSIGRLDQYAVVNGVRTLYMSVLRGNGYIGMATSTPFVKLDINGGFRARANGASKPTCAADTRGEYWFTDGAAGVKDSDEVCAKDASNVYAWRTIY